MFQLFNKHYLTEANGTEAILKRGRIEDVALYSHRFFSKQGLH